jgi:hypothetical protein
MNNNSSTMRYVGFFDMLGFKDAVKKDFNEAWGALEDLRVSMEETLNLFIRLPQKIIMTNSRDRILATNFSDRILLFTLQDTLEDLHRMLLACAGFFGKALHRCVPLRGGIAYGDFLFNLEKNLFCGPSLIRAYELGQRAQWSGIVVDDEVATHYRRNPIKSYGRTVIGRKVIPAKIYQHETKQQKF